jgi:glycosyltransferase involved in cell wall biosynthesis
MLVLHTAHSYPPDVSGVAEVVRQVSERLVGRGHEVHVATRARPGYSVQQRLRGVNVHRFELSGNWVLGLSGDVAGYRTFARSRPWDVVAFHCAQSCTTDALLEVFKDLSGRKVFVGHGLSQYGSAGYAAYYELLARNLAAFDGLVALSNLLEESELCRMYGLNAPVAIPNGVDLAEWTRETCGLRCRWNVGPRPWLVSISNHSPVKGHARFRTVACRLRARRPDLVATIVGDSYPAERWGLGRAGVKGGCWYACRAASLFDRTVQLRSGLPRSDVISVIKEATVVLVTSHREASPLVVLESMAAGTPWVSFDVGSVRENPGGLVALDEEDFVRNVSLVLDDRALREELGRQGKARVAERHDWDLIAAQYEALYSRLATK